jgi:MFS superfamily sulfate permease-like transporter
MNPSLRRTKTHWLFGYQKEWLRWDLIAGLITAAVVIPKAMAYATIAGLPVQVGLYTVLLPMAIYAMIGTSRPLSVSTTTTLAILAASALSRAAVADDPTSLIKSVGNPHSPGRSHPSARRASAIRLRC